MIQTAFKERIHLHDKQPHIIFTDSAKVSAEQIAGAKNIDGVNIVV